MLTTCVSYECELLLIYTHSYFLPNCKLFQNISSATPLSCCFKKKKKKKNPWSTASFIQWTKLVCFALTRLDLLPVCEWNSHQHNVMWLHSVTAAAEAAKKGVLDIQRIVQIFGFWGLGKGKDFFFPAVFILTWFFFFFLSLVFCIKV